MVADLGPNTCTEEVLLSTHDNTVLFNSTCTYPQVHILSTLYLSTLSTHLTVFVLLFN